MLRSKQCLLILLIVCLFIGNSTLNRVYAADSPALSYRVSSVGPFGGDAKSLVVDPADPKRLYLGTTDGQIYRSKDAAQNWERLLTFDHPGYSVDKIIIDEKNPQTIYVPVWFIANDTDGTIYKTTDGGDTWQELTPMKGHSVRNLTIAPMNNQMMIAAAIDGAYISYDAGATWARYSPPNHPDIKRLHSVAIDPQNPNIVYLGTEHLPWRTEDGGKTWVCVKGTSPEKKQQFIDDSDIFSIVIDRNNPNRIYASACSGIYNTSDRAATWAKYQGIPFTSRRTHLIYPDPTNEQTIYSCTTEGLWKTNNGGTSWRPMTSIHTVCNAIALHPTNPNRLYLAIKFGGVLVSDNGGESFHPANNGFVNRQISTLIADRTKPGRLYAAALFNGFEGGLYISNDNGLSWQLSIRSMVGEDIYVLYQSAAQDQTLYAGTNLGLYISNNHGENWTRISGKAPLLPTTTPLTSTKGKVGHSFVASSPAKGSKRSSKKGKTPSANITERVVGITTRYSAKGTDGVLVASWGGLYQVKEDTGAAKLNVKTRNGNIVSTPTPAANEAPITKLNVDGYNGRILSVATHPAQPDTIYVGTQQGIYITNDNGKSWQRPTLDPETTPVVVSIAINPHNPKVIMAGTQYASYLSNDGGQSWQRRGHGIPYGEILAIRFSPIDPNLIVVGDYRVGGLYVSTDGGENFQQIELQVSSSRITTMSFDSVDAKNLYIGSFSGGVYVVNVNNPTFSSQK